MSINSATAALSTPSSGDGFYRAGRFSIESGVSYPRLAPKTLLIVIALHAAALAALAQYQTEITPPVPPVTVTLIPAEPEPVAPEPEIVPPKPLPATPKPVKKKAEPKPEKRPEPKPVVEPEPQLVSQAPAPVPAPSVAPPPVVHEPVPVVREATPEPQPAPPPAPPAPVEEVPVNPPSFNANYLDNPAPAYPSISRRLGEQGRVLLRVQVTPEGAAKNVVLHKSSGFDRLDRVALETVRRWKFVPARQGEKPVEAWVIVPIQFNLKG